MAEGKQKVDLSLLRVSPMDVRRLVSNVLFYGNKGAFFEFLQRKKFEKDLVSDRSKLLDLVKDKLEHDKIRELTNQECPVLLKYLVGFLGRRFLDSLSSVIEAQLKKSLSTLRGGIVAHNPANNMALIDSSKVIEFFNGLNKEHVMKWVFFLDNLPAVSKDETEESEIRESCERIIEWMTISSVKEDHLKDKDWKILKNCISYFGAGAYFKPGEPLPNSSYSPILPFSLDSLTVGLSPGTRESFIKKSVEEKLSLLRPPVIDKNNLRDFLLDGKKNYEILGVLEQYYRNLKQDIKRRSGPLKIFGVYYETLAEVVRTSRNGNDRMLQPTYLDSINYAINFEDFRNLNEDGFGIDLHGKGKWLRKMTGIHLGMNIDDPLLEPIRNLRAGISKGDVDVYVFSFDEGKKTPDEKPGVSKKKTPGPAQREAPVSAEKENTTGETDGPVLASAPPLMPGMGWVEKPKEPEVDPKNAEKVNPTPLLPGLIQENRNSHVLPIDLSNIEVALIGNKPPLIFHPTEKKEKK